MYGISALVLIGFTVLTGSLNAMELKSDAFKNTDKIPPKYTGDSIDASPPLHWTKAPEAVKSFALICDDPDAPGKTWVHWVIFNIPSDKRDLRENIPTKPVLQDGSIQGITDFYKNGYSGPYPPPGKAHRYFFKLYALNATLNLTSSATKADVEEAMKTHIIAETSLEGVYQR